VQGYSLLSANVTGNNARPDGIGVGARDHFFFFFLRLSVCVASPPNTIATRADTTRRRRVPEGRTGPLEMSVSWARSKVVISLAAMRRYEQSAVCREM